MTNKVSEKVGCRIDREYLVLYLSIMCMSFLIAAKR